MSSGLVASMALPAHAVSSPPEAVGPATSAIPVIPGTSAGEALFTAPEGGLLALPPDSALDDVTVVAPAAAMVNFDHSSFTVVPGDAVGSGTGGVETTPAPTTRKERRQTVTTPKASARVSAARVTDGSGSTAVVAPASTGSGSKAVAVAFRYQGTPYLWGGNSPRGFDCSGFTRYVYAQLGKKIGRTVADQRGDVKMVSRSQAKPGDLVFFGSSHIGIYLGNNQMIDAPRRGKTIQPRKIYSANVQFGRVI